MPLGLDAFDVGRGWALLEIREELLKRPLVALRHDLNRAVRAVAHIALEVQSPSHLPNIEAIADALHLSIDSSFQLFLFHRSSFSRDA